MKKALLAVVICHCCLAISAHAARLNLTRIGEGTINPDIGAYSYSWGKQITITATPAPGWVVDHWEGDITGIGSSKTFTMYGDKRVTVVFQPQVATPANALVRYVGQHDNNYGWTLKDRDTHFGWNKHTIRMRSQQWRSPSEVDRVFWDHDVGIIEPWFADNRCALLVNGGTNGSDPPEELDSNLAAVAILYGISYAQVDQIPNQPLFFNDEAGNRRSEDEIIAYSLDKFLVTGDSTWPVHVAMTKSVVRAMDTIQRQLPYIKDFLVAGGSKRGWTTYLVAAVDPRVAAMAPLSIDIPSFVENTRHHFEAYGFYSPAVHDYVDFDLFCRADTPEGHDLLQIIDPLLYFSKYTMPKLLLNSAGISSSCPIRAGSTTRVCRVRNGSVTQ